jgi:small-conductance mechanosensitive channel
VSNFISGFILLFEGAIRPGDVINVEGIEGVVQSIELRSVHVITNDGIELIIPSSKLLEEVVINYTRSSARMRLRVSVGVSYKEDMNQVKSLLLRAANHPVVLQEPSPSVQLMDFGDSSVNFDLLVWISEAAQASKIRSDLRVQIWDLFSENQIEIPFPQRVMHMSGRAEQ